MFSGELAVNEPEKKKLKCFTMNQNKNILSK